jgi:hypothetical protein
MNSSIVRRARTTRLVGWGVMLAGFLPVLWFLAQSVLASGTRQQAGLAIAVAGFAVMTIGATIVRRQLAVLEAAARYREDGLRRARQYYDGERIEPYIGPGLVGGAQLIRDEER